MLTYGRGNMRYNYRSNYYRGARGRGAPSRGRFNYMNRAQMPYMMQDYPAMDNMQFSYGRVRAISDSIDMPRAAGNRGGGAQGYGRPRPLARLVARSRAARNRPLRRGECEAYRMEVNEVYLDRDNDSKGPIPCVTVLDFKRIVPNDVSQRRLCIPVALSDIIVKYLRKCKVTSKPKKKVADDEIEEDVKDEEANDTVPTMTTSGAIKYDVSLLASQTFKCPKTGKVVEIEVLDGVDGPERHLRSYMNVPDKKAYKQGDPVEKIELRNDLMKSLDRFLSDVALRYRNIKADVTISSLYSYSGERRFYFDIRKTRWGLRLHVSQVTDMHRNVVGIPLESVVQFRNRLNDAIKNLRLEDETVTGGFNAGRRGMGNNRKRRGRAYPNRRGLQGRGKKRGQKNTSESENAAVEQSDVPGADGNVDIANGGLPEVAVEN